MARRPLSLLPACCAALLAVSSALLAPPAPSLAADGAWVPLDPGNLMDQSLTPDPARSRAILFGGYDGHAFNNSSLHRETWALDLTGDLAWHRLLPSGTWPSPRIEHSVVLDPTRNRMILFGGKTITNYFNDLWSLDLTGGGTWAPLAANGTPPAPIETRGIYDPIRDRVVYFGGYRPSIDVNELWQLSLSGTPTWSPLSAANSPPPPRAAHSMIYDPFGDRVIVFGGLRGNLFLNDVWQLTLGGVPTWTQLLPTGGPPPPRYGHQAVFDPLRMRMIVYGGFNNNDGFLGDVWALDLVSNTWSQLLINPAAPLLSLPLARDFPAMVYDQPNDRLVVHGGNTQIIGSQITMVLGDAWGIELEGGSTPVQVATAESDATPDLVRIRWHVSSIDRSYTVLRSEDGALWSSLGSVSAGSGGFVTFEDHDVRAGATYFYRLQFEDEGVTQFGGQLQVLVPLEFSLRLDAAPLISDGRFSVELTLPTPSAAHLAIYDVSGRRVAEQNTGTLPAGRHAIDFGASSRFGPGVYWVRLERANSTLQRRVVLIR
jgi:Galactose oxidase, central domain